MFEAITRASKITITTYGLVVSLAAVGGCGKSGDAVGAMDVMSGADSADPMQMMGAGMMHDMTKMSAMMVQHLGSADAMYDARFIMMMIPHHEGAVTMSQDALINASRPELKELAQSIITSQQAEIATMKQWQSQWSGGTMPAMGKGMMSDEMMTKMHAQMTAGLLPKDAGYEGRFIDMMIPHHQGAIDMAKDAIAKANHPELKDFARNIIAAQEREIKLMTELRKQWYGR